MSEHSTQLSIEDESTYSAAAFPANLSVLLDSVKGQMTRATCGPLCLESFARFNRATFWAKMFTASLIGRTGWYSSRCVLTWNLSATKSHRMYFRLRVSTLPTEGIESGLLLTPTTSEPVHDLEKFKARMEKYPNGTTMPNLATQVHGMLPTPLSSDNGEKITGLENQNSLTKMARELTGKTSQLSPLFVEEMMGFPENWTASPFQSGEENPSKPTATP